MTTIIKTIHLNVNGTNHSISATGGKEKLLFVLREECGLTGVRYGCGKGLCGACTVIIDGNARRSCRISARAAAGKKIVTIEGLSKRNFLETTSLHPVQQAFIDFQVPQCGFCMSGQIMQAVALFGQNASPSPAEIKHALRSNICRCGAYVRIVKALTHLAGRKNEINQ